MTPIFDTHAHYDDNAFDEDREELLLRLQQNGVAHAVNVAANIDECHKTISIVQKYPFLYGAIGVHPDEIALLTEEDMTWMTENAHAEKIVAIGEIGLDYYWDEAPRELQKKWFARQLEVARTVHMPVIIHSRDAAADTYDIMHAEHAEEIGGVIHCYSYSKEMAPKYLDMNFFFGIGGVVTFKNARVLKEVVEYLPIDSIVTETDSPYLAPEPYRGSRNHSGNIQFVLQKIAEIKNMDEDEVRKIVYNNALRLYRIKQPDR